MYAYPLRAVKSTLQFAERHIVRNGHIILRHSFRFRMGMRSLLSLIAGDIPAIDKVEKSRLGNRSDLRRVESARHTRHKAFELQILENGKQLLPVRRTRLEAPGIHIHRDIRADGGEKLGKPDVLRVFLHFLPERTLEVPGIVEKILHAAEIPDQLHRRLLAHTRTTGNVVHLVAHQCQQIDHL